jgi:hypothetical protein
MSELGGDGLGLHALSLVGIASRSERDGVRPPAYLPDIAVVKARARFSKKVTAV